MRGSIDGMLWAFAYFSVAPVRIRRGTDLGHPKVLRTMVLTLPLVGLGLGLVTLGVVTALSHSGGYAPLIAAILYPMLYGYLHTEAVMDVTDALYGAHSGKDPYTIIKDPTVGAMGVLWGGGLLLLKTALLAAFLSGTHPLIWLTVPVLSRLGLVGLIASMTFRSRFIEQLHAAVPMRTFGLLALGVVGIGTVVFGWRMLILAFTAGLTSYLTASTLQKRLGFANGDVLGTTLEITESVLLGVIVLGGWHGIP